MIYVFGLLTAAVSLGAFAVLLWAATGFHDLDQIAWRRRAEPSEGLGKSQDKSPVAKADAGR